MILLRLEVAILQNSYHLEGVAMLLMIAHNKKIRAIKVNKKIKLNLVNSRLNLKCS